MRAAIFQPPYPRCGEASASLQWMLTKLDALSKGCADIVVLPEYSNCLGAESREEILSAIRGEGRKLLESCSAAAGRLGAIIMAGVVTEDETGHFHNQLMVVETDKAPYFPYSKNYPVEAEFQEGFLPGKAPGVFEINGIRYGAAICFDFYFPELFAHYMESRIDVLIIPSLQRRETAERLHYLARARAFDCGCTLLRSSVAMPDCENIAGRSMVIGPDGIIKADAGGRPGVLFTEFDPKDRFIQPASYDRPGQIDDYRETRLRVKQIVSVFNDKSKED
ncbi:MAG: carbon-nitrogen hydrolase family protein [Oligosphaeraceae bacterium]|nr:carbon-nitrogen hydrolase family protein [Oligosphaeraceae bacterium]